MERDKLPARRRSWTHKVKIGDTLQTFYLNFGEYDDGRLGEVFIDAAKEGTFVRGVLGAVARMTSLALQWRVPISEIVNTLRHINFTPNGAVESGDNVVKVCSSVVDALAQEINAYYGNGNSDSVGANESSAFVGSEIQSSDAPLPSDVLQCLSEVGEMKEMTEMNEVVETLVEVPTPYLTEGWKQHGTGYYHKGLGV